MAPTPALRQYALTYPRCELNKERAVEELRKLDGVESIVVAQEHHAESDEEGAAGLHLHAFLSFKNRTRRNTEFFDICGHHGNVKSCRNVKGWITYITKEDKHPACFNYDVEAALTGKATGLTASVAATMTTAQLVEAVHPRDLQRTLAGASLARMILSKPTDLTAPCGIWLQGRAGVGKSLGIRRTFPSIYLKDHNKWWDGYDGEEVVVVDDVHLDAKWLVHFLKVWADAYAFKAETKGGMMTIRPRLIIVTSNFPLEDLGRTTDYKGAYNYMLKEDLAALQRRFTEFLVTEPGQTEEFLRAYLPSIPPVVPVYQAAHNINSAARYGIESSIPETPPPPKRFPLAPGLVSQSL